MLTRRLLARSNWDLFRPGLLNEGQQLLLPVLRQPFESLDCISLSKLGSSLAGLYLLWFFGDRGTKFVFEVDVDRFLRVKVLLAQRSDILVRKTTVEVMLMGIDRLLSPVLVVLIRVEVHIGSSLGTDLSGGSPLLLSAIHVHALIHNLLRPLADLFAAHQAVLGHLERHVLVATLEILLLHVVEVRKAGGISFETRHLRACTVVSLRFLIDTLVRSKNGLVLTSGVGIDLLGSWLAAP